MDEKLESGEELPKDNDDTKENTDKEEEKKSESSSNGEKSKNKTITIKNLNKKRMVAVVLSGVVLACSNVALFKATRYFYYDKVPSIDLTVSEVITYKSNDSIIYELLSSDMISSMDTLDLSTELYSKLIKLNLDRYDSEDLNNQEVQFDKSEIESLINTFKQYDGKVDLKTPCKETNEFYQATSKLLSYKKLLTTENYLEGAATINLLAQSVFKAIIIDSQDLDYSDVNNIEIDVFHPNNKSIIIKYTDVLSGKVYYLETKNYGILNTLTEKIELLNSTVDKYIKGEYKTPYKLANIENEVIQCLKASILFSYEIKNGVIKQNENNFTLAKKYL